MPSSPATFWQVWQAVASGMTAVVAVVGGVGGIIIGNEQSEIADLKAAVLDLNVRMAPLLTLYAQHASDAQLAAGMQKEIERKVDREVFVTFDRLISGRVTESDASAAARNGEVVDQLHKLENDIVTRAENMVHWQVVDALTLRVNDLSKPGVCPR